MSDSIFKASIVSPVTVLLLALLSFPGSAFARDDGNVLFLSDYLYGDYYYARLRDVDRSNPRHIRPRKLRLPSDFRSNVELGNHDVSYDGKSIVFAARMTSNLDWDIYRGKIDLRKRRITNVELVVGNVGTRDEDPRFSWDGKQIVYKCNGNICIYPENGISNPVVKSWCELWAPSIDVSGYRISYTKRCSAATADRVWQYDRLTGEETDVPSAADSMDRFASFLSDGRLLYSHADSTTGRSSLWVHDAGYVSLLHDRSISDDDSYPDKHDPDHIAFIGWEDDGYNLFMYRSSRQDSVRLSSGIPILAPVLFRKPR